MTDLVSKLLGKEQDFELELLGAILDNDPQGVIVIDEVTRHTDKDGKVVYEGGNLHYVNKFFLELFGYGWTSKLVGTPVHKFVAKRFRDTHPELLANFFEHPRHMKLEARGHNRITGERQEGSQQRLDAKETALTSGATEEEAERTGEEIPLGIEIAPYERSDGKRLAIAYIREKK